MAWLASTATMSIPPAPPSTHPTAGGDRGRRLQQPPPLGPARPAVHACTIVSPHFAPSLPQCLTTLPPHSQPHHHHRIPPQVVIAEGGCSSPPPWDLHALLSALGLPIASPTLPRDVARSILGLTPGATRLTPALVRAHLARVAAAPPHPTALAAAAPLAPRAPGAAGPLTSSSSSGGGSSSSARSSSSTGSSASAGGVSGAAGSVSAGVAALARLLLQHRVGAAGGGGGVQAAGSGPAGGAAAAPAAPAGAAGAAEVPGSPSAPPSAAALLLDYCLSDLGLEVDAADAGGTQAAGAAGGPPHPPTSLAAALAQLQGLPLLPLANGQVGLLHCTLAPPPAGGKGRLQQQQQQQQQGPAPTYVLPVRAADLSLLAPVPEISLAHAALPPRLQAKLLAVAGTGGRFGADRKRTGKLRQQ